jgi:FlaA1/EpsC-like NDP-sugar epimerase
MMDVSRRLRAAVAARRRVIIYGAGTHTAELMRHCGFLSGHVAAMVDGNPTLQGHRFLGIPVESPRALPELEPDLIVISARTAEQEIAAYLAALGLGDLVVTLYATAEATA